MRIVVSLNKSQSFNNFMDQISLQNPLIHPLILINLEPDYSNYYFV